MCSWFCIAFEVLFVSVLLELLSKLKHNDCKNVYVYYDIPIIRYLRHRDSGFTTETLLMCVCQTGFRVAWVLLQA